MTTNAPFVRPCAFLPAIVAAALACPGVATASPVTTDPWDVSQGATPTAWSRLNEHTTYINNMFGGTQGGIEPGTTLYPDFPENQFGGTPLPAGTVHWVEWRTPQPIMLTGFNLYASCDSPSSTNRAMSHFLLEGKRSLGDSWTVLCDVPVGFPYWPGDAPLLSPTLSSPFRSQYYRAEFTSGTNNMWACGPRIIELDAIVPEPATLSLLALGGLALLRRKRRANA